MEQPAEFDETGYLTANPDVWHAVRAGQTTAWEHYEKHGRAEGRSGAWSVPPTWNRADYLRANDDVAVSVRLGQLTPEEHWARFGMKEHRSLPSARAANKRPAAPRGQVLQRPTAAPPPKKPARGSRGPREPLSRPHRSDLAHALQECRTAAKRGYQIAKANLSESEHAVADASASLSRCLKALDDGTVRTPGIVAQLRDQLLGVVTELATLQNLSESTLEDSRQRLDRFSITLFGRTMAGKSTLMEILTRGDGRSIGTGAQRTTRDVRAYNWNGLEVTDVPGVAAFDGAEDEELAFKAASQADLVLFLITDDAPQPVEAECLARVRRLGKPVLGICNVKVAVDDEDDLLLFLRDPDKPFDGTRLTQLLNQFHAFADQHIPGKRVPFVATHLRSRFLAHLPQYAKHKERLCAASRFDEIESRLVREVVGRGTFLRVKSFVDGAVAPLLDVTDLLLEFSAQNSGSGRVMIDKRRQLREWSQTFRGDGQKRIDTFISKVMDGLRDEVPSFAEDHYEDNSAGESWKHLVQSTGIDSKVENLQQQLLDECQKALSEVARELKSELSLVADLSGDRHIKMDSIFNVKRAWNWGTNILAGGLGIAALILGSGPLGWAAAAVGAAGWLISWFFDDREEKARRARDKLTKRLLGNIDKMEGDLRGTLGDWFHQALLGQQVYVLLDDL
ncbi:MAG: GTPase, partial [Gemmatimonadaceae bacterium]|nr:GTPase [Gemmatimonadaceae bacterium]